MTNLDYEQRMSALNQLIHETLGVSLNTVRAAYGRARNTTVNVKSTASETGRLPRSSSRTMVLAQIASDHGQEARLEPAYLGPNFMSTDAFLDLFPLTMRPSFLTRFRKASTAPVDEYQPQRLDGLPMTIFSGQDDFAGESASDWHRLRNEFWSIAQQDRVVMERYKHDVLG